MASANHWWTFDYHMVQFEKAQPGVYELADVNRELLYIGCAQEVRDRLQQHLARPQSGECFRKARYFRVEYADNYVERCDKMMARYASLHQGRFPPCNPTAT